MAVEGIPGEGFGEFQPPVRGHHRPRHHDNEPRGHEQHGFQNWVRHHKVKAGLGILGCALAGWGVLGLGGAKVFGHSGDAHGNHNAHHPGFNVGGPGGNHLGLPTSTATPEQSPLVTPSATEVDPLPSPKTSSSTTLTVTGGPTPNATHSAAPIPARTTPPAAPPYTTAPAPVRTTPVAPLAKSATATPLWECPYSTQTPDPSEDFTNWVLVVGSGTLRGTVTVTRPNGSIVVNHAPVGPVSAADRYNYAFGNVGLTDGDPSANGYTVDLQTNAGSFSHTFNEC